MATTNNITAKHCHHDECESCGDPCDGMFCTACMNARARSDKSVSNQMARERYYEDPFNTPDVDPQYYARERAARTYGE